MHRHRVLEADSCRQESVCPRAKLHTMAGSAVRIDNVADGGAPSCQKYEVAGRGDAVAAGAARHTNNV